MKENSVRELGKALKGIVYNPMQLNAKDFQVYDRDVPGSIQCLTSCKFLVLSKLGSMTLFVCFRNLIANTFLRKTQKDKTK